MFRHCFPLSAQRIHARVAGLSTPMTNRRARSTAVELAGARSRDGADLTAMAFMTGSRSAGRRRPPVRASTSQAPIRGRNNAVTKLPFDVRRFGATFSLHGVAPPRRCALATADRPARYSPYARAVLFPISFPPPRGQSIAAPVHISLTSGGSRCANSAGGVHASAWVSQSVLENNSGNCP